MIGVLASDRVQLGDITIGNASLGLVTEASVDLMGASCAGVLVSSQCLGNCNLGGQVLRGISMIP